jgi:hypothetical protein
MTKSANRSKKKRDSSDTDQSFYRRLAWFRARNRQAAWEFLVKQEAIDTGRALELQGMIKRDPVAFRKAMIELARDTGVLGSLFEYAPFDLRVDCRGKISRLNMAVMIAEAIASDHGGWEARRKLPRKHAGSVATRSRNGAAAKEARV